MSFEYQELLLKDCLVKVVDNRGKTPPLAEKKTKFPLIEVASLVGDRREPNLDAARKYVNEETYLSWFRSGHPNYGDILFSTVGSIAEVALVKNENICIAQNIIGLRPNNNIITSNFLYYFFKNPSTQKNIKTLDISSVQPSIKVPHLLNQKIKIPSLKTQEEISELLSLFDDRITLLRETNTTLEAIAQALFKSWFVDFDPVHAKQQGCAPEGMDAQTAALFPDSFEESELGMVPKRWKLQTLAEAYEINPFRKLSKGQKATYLDMANVPTQGYSVGELIEREFGSGTKFKNHDTLLARITPCLENGKTAYVDFLGEDAIAWGSTEFIGRCCTNAGRS